MHKIFTSPRQQCEDDAANTICASFAVFPLRRPSSEKIRRPFLAECCPPYTLAPFPGLPPRYCFIITQRNRAGLLLVYDQIPASSKSRLLLKACEYRLSVLPKLVLLLMPPYRDDVQDIDSVTDFQARF
jgi:hypothetical protein